MIQSRSPSSARSKPRESTRRFMADTVDAAPRLLMRLLGRGGSSSRRVRWISARPGPAQRLRVEGAFAREQLVEQHAERVDVRAGVDVEVRHLRLLGAHVLRRADELPELGEERVLGEPLRGGLGDAEVDDLRRVLLVLASSRARSTA